MTDLIDGYIKEIEAYQSYSQDEIENFRIKYLSKKGIVPSLFEQLKNTPPDQKKVIGQKINALKNKALEKIAALREQSQQSEEKALINDLTSPPEIIPLGSRHPVSIVRRQIIDIFSRIGFTVEEGPEIEDDWHVFSGLNFPEEHPARDMQDTFFIELNPDILLRTHTSSVQVRVMENSRPPIRKIFPGRVFRNEVVSARAHCIFHQVEGLYIDKNVSFADLKQTLLFFAKEMFGEATRIRLRPAFFPFTEPSAEMDISCSICGGKGCNICKYTGFVEILGCGMVDPDVLEASDISSTEYTGFAFGMGIERVAMLKYHINDLRLFFENDLRFLNQFKGDIT
jgi:phenylalanyl-tRNA synthetase alpha chain